MLTTAEVLALQVSNRELQNEVRRLQTQLVKMDEALNRDIDAAVERALKAGMKGTDELRASLGALPDEDIEAVMQETFQQLKDYR